MAFLLLGALLASAAPETPLHTQWRACTDRKTNKYDFGECGGTYVRAADKALNVASRSPMSAVSAQPQTRAALLTEQRAWLAYREKACAFYGIQSDRGREGEVLSAPECLDGVLERRTAELRTYLSAMSGR